MDDPQDDPPPVSLPFPPSRKRRSRYGSFTNLSIYKTIFYRRFDPFSWFPLKEILLRTIHSFVLAFGVKSGISMFLKWLSLLKLPFAKSRGKWLPAVLHATVHNRDAVRLATFFALFTALFHLAFNSLLRFAPLFSLRQKGFVAGAVAGLALLVEARDTRMVLVQQSSMRALQTLYNSLKGLRLIHFPVGDSLVFVLSSAQIMYAFIRHPATLPADLARFMASMAHLPRAVLDANQRCLAREPVVSPALAKYLAQFPAAAHACALIPPAATLPALPCSLLHPDAASCTLYQLSLFKSVFAKIFPVYFTLHFVPGLLFKTRQIITTPLHFLTRVLQNTLRSGCFLSVYVTLFQTLVCMHRTLVRRRWLSADHKLNYFLFGLVNSLSIFIEAKQRRAELGMYVAPKAIHSLYQLATAKNNIARPPFADVFLFSLGMGVLMSYYLAEAEHVSPMVARILKRFFF